MARILYGVHGTGHGHAMRALTIARALPDHEFLFVANDDATAVLHPEFRTVPLPNLGTSFRNYRVDFSATIKKALPLLLRQGKYIGEAEKIIKSFQPDVCMADLEYFVPRAAKKLSIPCLTLDHQHVLTCCRHTLPKDMLTDYFVQGLTPRFLFRPTESSILISFYQPEVLPRFNAMVAPPILRQKVLDLSPHDEGHVLVYQSNSTDRRLIEFLRSHVRDKTYIFGYSQQSGEDGNLIFMNKSEDRFLQLLSGARYVIQGGSHTLMSEALFLGKPILSLPIMAMVEQRLNAIYLEKLGYGKQAAMEELDGEFISEFEERLPLYRKNIAKNNFCGNSLVFRLVDQFARTGKCSFENV